MNKCRMDMIFVRLPSVPIFIHTKCCGCCIGWASGQCDSATDRQWYEDIGRFAVGDTVENSWRDTTRSDQSQKGRGAKTAKGAKFKKKKLSQSHSLYRS